MSVINPEKYSKYLNTLSNVGIALSSVKDHTLLLEMIVSGAMRLTNADGCTLYLVVNNSQLNFEIIANKTLKIAPKKINKENFTVAPIPLYDEHGKPNLKNIVSYCYHETMTQHIPDAYQTVSFDFSGTRAADEKLGYHSKSLLTIPLRDHENKIVGILELINAIDEDTDEIIGFSKEKIHLAEAFASQAATELTRQELIQRQKDLFEALLKLIASAIDEKCTYTSNHCTRVPIITSLIAEAVNNVTTGPLKDFHMTKDQIEELRIAAWLHDCGKITTPEHVINKSTKLEGLNDRIDIVLLRMEIVKKEVKIAFLEKQLQEKQITSSETDKTLQKSLEILNEAQEFLTEINHGRETLADEDIEKIHQLAQNYYYLDGKKYPLLTKDEVTNLCVSRGTLNESERKIIQNHVKVTQNILQSLPYPEHLKHVPEIAGNHHEHVDGHGYPKGLTKDKMSMQSRIVAIADIFEALTAVDRPYKKANTLSEALKIMADMKTSGHIDADLFDLFLHDKLYLNYANKYLKPEQLDA